uniref:Protease PrsW n=1 Tax=uncultured Armatimonadetes bacterium TaxID=157466 RepID=A0A6J4HEM3_9BACT|nr:hypothetical protein AVDCRST_MAG63-400 [uncultured Armatimonadetes bacterium]
MRDHLKSATNGIWFEVGGVLLFVAVVAGLNAALRPTLDGTGRLLAGVLLAVVPALIWLTAFYRQDKFEPEPKKFVLGVFLLGALLAQAVGQPLIRSLFRVDNWFGAHPAVQVITTVLIVGIIQEFLKYAAVRYTVFDSPEYDQRVDGIIYGASAGLGYATVVNILYVVERQGVDLAVGAINVAVATLAHASFAGLMGYFLGRAKFDSMGPFWLPIGLLISATLNGVVTYLLGQVVLLGNGFDVNPINGLIVAVALAGATFALLFRHIRRLREEGAGLSPASA